MPRSPITSTQRVANITTACTALPDAVARAWNAHNAHGATDARTLRAWTVVESHGATIHRNGRLLAGKAKGG